MHAATFPSPFGTLYAARDAAGLTMLRSDGDRFDAAPARGDAFADLRAQLDEYFAGTRTTFELELSPAGTPFQQRVWAKLREIPYGATRSYRDIAHELGTSARAVGHANARNPIWIVVPCHRVIGAGGDLTGYAGGIATKHALLTHERAL